MYISKKVLMSIVISFIGLMFAQKLNNSSIPFEPKQIIRKISGNNNSNFQQPYFLIDTSITSLPGIGEQRSPAVAFDGTNYLIVYTEYRHGTPRIYGIRVTQDGRLLDPTGICISFKSESQYNPSVAFDGINYFVVWQDHRNPEEPPPYNNYVNADIYGARVSPGGQVLDPDGILIDTTPGPQRDPVLAFNGTNYLVVWCYDNDIYGRRVSPTGHLLERDITPISTANYLQQAPSIASDGTDFLIVWEDFRNLGGWIDKFVDIYGARIDQSGILLDTTGIEIMAHDSCRQTSPSTSFDGTNYFVVWQDKQTDTTMFDICGARVNTSGIVIDTLGIEISTAHYSQTYPSITFNGTNYFITWQDRRNGVYNFDIYGARVSPSGYVIDTSGIAVSTADSSQCYPAIACCDTNYLAVWQDTRLWSNPNQDMDKQYDIFCTRISESGQVIDPSGMDLSIQRPADQYCPAVAFDGNNYLIVWHDFQNESFPEHNADIYGIRIDESGQILDSMAITISSATHDQLLPKIAFGGSDYLIVWEDHRNPPNYGAAIYGARVSQSGIVLDPEGIEIPCDDYYHGMGPSISFDGTNYLVVWYTEYYYAGIRGARISQSGVVLDSISFVIDTTFLCMGDAETSVKYGTDTYLAAWIRWGGDIYCTRISTSGTVVDTIPIQISNGQYRTFSPSIAFDGNNFFIVWGDTRNSTSSYIDSIDIYGARINQSGVLLDTSNIRISQGPGYQACPSVEFDGNDFLVVWQDSRSDSSYDIYGAKVNPAGAIVNRYQIIAQPGHQFEPSIARGNNDEILITYSGWADSINGFPADAMRIWGTFYPFVGIKENQQSEVLTHFDLNISPNPFTRKAKIDFSVDKHLLKTQCIVEIFDVTGRLVKKFDHLVDKLANQVLWDGTDRRGQNLPAGTYFCRLKSGNNVLSKKIIFLK